MYTKIVHIHAKTKESTQRLLEACSPRIATSATLPVVLPPSIQYPVYAALPNDLRMTIYGFLTTKELLNKITNLSHNERHTLKVSKIISCQQRSIRFKFSPESNRLYFKKNSQIESEIGYQMSLASKVSIEMSAWCPSIILEKPA